MSRMIEPFGITVEINTDIDLVPILTILYHFNKTINFELL